MSRTPPRRVALVSGLAALTLPLAACGAQSTTTTTATADSTTTGPSTQATPNADVVLPDTIPEQVLAEHEHEVTGEALTTYGQAAVQAAYREMIQYTFENTWASALIRDTSVQRSDFDRQASYMTPSCAASLYEKVDAALAADASDIAQLNVISTAFYSTTAKGGLTPVPNGNVVTDRSFTPAQATVETWNATDRLTLTFQASATIVMQDAQGARYKVPTSRALTFHLAPNPNPTAPAKPWLIDGWRQQMNSSDPQRLA